MGEHLEMPRDPLALGRGLDQHERRRPTAGHRGESLARRGDPALGQLAVGSQNADRGLSLVELSRLYAVEVRVDPRHGHSRSCIPAVARCPAVARTTLLALGLVMVAGVIAQAI